MQFPVHLLRPEQGSIDWGDSGTTLEISLQPFELLIEGEVECVETSIEMECVPLPFDRPSDLQGKAFRFPKNPEDGYIDASIYIWHRHHPVDITSLSFGEVTNGSLPVEIEGRLCLEFEGLDEYRDADFVMKTALMLAAG